MGTFVALATGSTVVSLGSEELANPGVLFAALAQSDTSTWVSTPSFVASCLVEPGCSAVMLPRLRRFVFHGETLTPHLARQVLERFPLAQVWNTYGSTEAMLAAAVRIDRDILARYAVLPIGYPLPGCRTMIAGPAGEPLDGGASGEIVVAGPHVSPGYVGRPDLTARAFFTLDGMPAYRTGDWGHVLDGLLFFDGRRDDRVTADGHPIGLADIEAHLRSLSGVLDTIVLPMVSGRVSDYLVAFVTIADIGRFPAEEKSRSLREGLAQRVSPRRVPRQRQVLENLPAKPSGKPDRKNRAVES
jgi:D-alanine--poly(phosphoribitol) ligase subunit 1